MMCLCPRLDNKSPSSPSRGSISFGPPPWLPSDKVNNVCLTNPAHKYLSWKLPHPTPVTHTPTGVCGGIYTGPVLEGTSSKSISDPGQTFILGQTLNLAAR